MQRNWDGRGTKNVLEWSTILLLLLLLLLHILHHNVLHLTSYQSPAPINISNTKQLFSQVPPQPLNHLYINIL